MQKPLDPHITDSSADNDFTIQLIQLLIHLICTRPKYADGLNPMLNLPTFRRNYVDGVRLNFNNGQFGFVAGLHNGYFTDSDHLNDGNVGLDIAASIMIIPGLEFRLGFGYENNDQYDNSISGYNTWAKQLNSDLDDVELPAILFNASYLSRGRRHQSAQLLALLSNWWFDPRF